MGSQLGTIIIAGFKALFGDAIAKATGIHPDDDAKLQAIIEKIVERVVSGAVAEGEDMLRAELEALKVEVAWNELSTILRNTDDWFRPKGEIPKLDLPIEIVEPDSPSE